VREGCWLRLASGDGFLQARARTRAATGP
jgi:hypothetical protein